MSLGPDGTEKQEQRSFSRTMKRVTAITAGAALTSSAGCLETLGVVQRPRGPGNGTVPGGGVPALQDIQPEDATHQATTVGELQDHAQQNDGRIVWIPNGQTLDLSGQDLTISGITIASGRSAEGRNGAVITTSDEGNNSPAWGGGDGGVGLITMEDNARLTGVEVRGPHTNVTDHSAIPGYFPFAPGGASARRRWREARFARGINVAGNNVSIDNAEIWGFSVQGIAVGSERFAENCSIAYCRIHNTMMTSYGYCIDVRHGTCTVYRTYMDAARHAMCGSGYADANYTCIECTIGPWTSSHPIDMHRVGENTSGSSDPAANDYQYRAGGTILLRRCDLIANRVPDLPMINHNRGGSTPHVTIRGVPGDMFLMEGCRCSHESPSAGVTQSGVPGRYQPNEQGYVNMNLSGNQWGVGFQQLNQVP